MSRLKKTLKILLEKELGIPCRVSYIPSSGWFFDTDLTCIQRIGYNYEQSLTFILGHDWEGLRKVRKKKEE